MIFTIMQRYNEYDDWFPLSIDDVSAPYFDSKEEAGNYIEKIIGIDYTYIGCLSIHAHPAKNDDMLLKNLKISEDKWRKNIMKHHLSITPAINCRCFQPEQLLNEDK